MAGRNGGRDANDGDSKKTKGGESSNDAVKGWQNKKIQLVPGKQNIRDRLYMKLYGPQDDDEPWYEDDLINGPITVVSHGDRWHGSKGHRPLLLVPGTNQDARWSSLRADGEIHRFWAEHRDDLKTRASPVYFEFTDGAPDGCCEARYRMFIQTQKSDGDETPHVMVPLLRVLLFARFFVRLRQLRLPCQGTELFLQRPKAASGDQAVDCEDAGFGCLGGLYGYQKAFADRLPVRRPRPGLTGVAAAGGRHAHPDVAWIFIFDGWIEYPVGSGQGRGRCRGLGEGKLDLEKAAERNRLSVWFKVYLPV
ncbi:hypothetical protein SPI_09083 [Niveomyces insectorum RCEF 264]|uniref:Uncharacterized protein n=1 Tax=Niveomyces insectorum RCEF 264 TaxID=1081102 RepID=A0A167MAY2_9HYPO|nr:hypothetical protein SPI_09083 [Niveomyces insectorum RCEF 264]